MMTTDRPLNLILYVYNHHVNTSSLLTEEEEAPVVSVAEDKLSNGSFLWIWPILIVIVTLGLIGNLIVLVGVGCVKHFRRPGNYLVANLSLASLFIMTSLISASVQTERAVISYGPWICRIFPGLHSFMVPAEGFTIMCLSLERTRAVREPFLKGTRANAVRKIAMIWTAALTLELPRGFLFYTHDESVDNCYKCRNTKRFLGSVVPYLSYLLINFLLAFLLPSVIMLRDFISLAGRLKFLISCQVWSFHHNSYGTYSKRLIRNALLFTTIFIVVKLPAGIYYVLYRMPENLIPAELALWIKEWRSFFFTLSILHGCFYPFIIFALSTEMRKYLCRGGRMAEPWRLIVVVRNDCNHVIAR